MKILIIMMIIISSMFADYSMENSKIKLSANNVSGKNGNMASVETSLKYSKNNFSIMAVPYAYYIDGPVTDQVFPNFSEKFKTSELFFRTLLLSYRFDKIVVGAGIIPLGNGFPMEYNENYFSDGMGMSMLSDIDPLGVFLKYEITECQSILMQYSTMDTMFIPTGTYLPEQAQKGSRNAMISYTYIEGKFKFLAEYLYADMKYNNKDAFTSNTFGLGFSYNDSEYSGWTVYDTVGHVHLKNNSKNVEGDMLADTNIPIEATIVYPDLFNFGTGETQTGWANLLGVRKDFEILDKEVFINAEWFHTYGDWISGNTGAPYTTNYNQTYNIRDNSYYLNLGLFLNKHTLIRVSHLYMQSVNTMQFGGLGTSASSVKKESEYITSLSLTYTF